MVYRGAGAPKNGGVRKKLDTNILKIDGVIGILRWNKKFDFFSSNFKKFFSPGKIVITRALFMGTSKFFFLLITDEPL